MKYINRIFLFFIIIITGCSNNNYKIIDEPEKILNNFKIQINLENKVKNLESLPKTIEMYKIGNGDLQDYTNSDKILLGINSKKNDINDFYVTTDEIGDYVYQMFGPTSLEFKNINDDYVYNESENIYYIDDTISSPNVISYIDKITYKDNLYHVTVYVGVKENDGIYGDFNKDSLIHVLDYNESDEIKKDKYMKFVYEFKTIAENTYIFSNLKRIYD